MIAGQRNSSAQQGANFAQRPTTQFDNDPFIIGIEEQLKCTCGCTLDVYTCRTTDFTCATSPAMHRQVISMVQNGMDEQEVLDAFVAQHGETVLMAPPAEGFNLVGYYLPGAAILTVGSALVWMLRRKFRIPIAPAMGIEEAAPTDVPRQDVSLTEADQALLEKELKDLGD